ncbi:hypothetical protein ACSNOI_36640 [Actinomadura kijaniata]|uniref:hypothetical protein n=1 Tax=Actinomadura kijaniata TaxID=46161 RepID=UPI003F1BE28A
MEAGFRFDDRYRLERRIGSTRVWCGWDELLDRRVAVRFVGDERPSPALRRHVQVRARSVARLSHPGIARIYDYGEVMLPGGGVRPYVVSELVAGESLEERLGRAGLGAAEAVAVCERVAEALAAAHAEGIAHGGLTADDVRLADGGVKLLGFEREVVEASVAEDLAALRTIMGRCSAGGAEVLDGLRERCRSNAVSSAEVADALAEARERAERTERAAWAERDVPAPAPVPARRRSSRRSRLVTLVAAAALVAVAAVPLATVTETLRVSAPMDGAAVPPEVYRRTSPTPSETPTAAETPAETPTGTPSEEPTPEEPEESADVPRDDATAEALERTLRSINIGLERGEIRPHVGNLLATRAGLLLNQVSAGRDEDVGREVAVLRTIIAQRTPHDITPERALRLSEPLREISTVRLTTARAPG